MSTRTNRLAGQLARFVQQYRREAQRGAEPNDRPYSREAESEMKRLPPDVLSELLSGESEDVIPSKESTVGKLQDALTEVKKKTP